jgi:aryl-alcohol dehydrogenase-like predicted oxidoreductase
MGYVKLGCTGLEVSRNCLGCMSYGASEQGKPDNCARAYSRLAYRKPTT